MADQETSKIRELPFEQEWMITTSRSSGPGGQHVNKVSTKIELRFNIPDSGLLNDDQKELLLNKLKNKITQTGDLIITSQSTRSQLKNREAAIEKFFTTLENALKPKKKRKLTKPTKTSQEKRLEEKKKKTEKKDLRKPPGLD
jgi:ribosome-associated protein